MDMDPQMLMMYSLMSGANGGSESVLPLLLMQQMNQTKALDTGGAAVGADDEFVSVLLYKPLGEKILANFAQKIQSMTAVQVARLLAAVSLESMGRSQGSKFGDMLVLTAHTGVMDLLGEPMAAVNGQTTSSALRSAGKVGGQILGPARKPIDEKVESLEVAPLTSKAPSARRDASPLKRKKTYSPVY